MEPTENGTGVPTRPLLQANDVLLDVLRGQVLNAIRVLCEKTPLNPPVVVNGSMLRRPKCGASGVELEDYDTNGLKNLLSKVAMWKTVKDNGASKMCFPPTEICNDLFSPGWAGVPVCNGVVHHPVVTGDKLLGDLGLDAKSGVWISGAAVTLPESGVTDVQLQEAVAELEYLFSGFPFKSAADKANCYGLIFTFVLRHMIDGVVPMHVTVAPAPGTGKSLLLEVIGILMTGFDVTFSSMPTSETEREKALPVYAKGKEFLFLDNVDGKLESATLEMMLTQPVIEYRKLGSSATHSYPNRGVIGMSGNNVIFSKALFRRSVFIQLDANMEKPELRTGFKIKDIRKYARLNRANILGSVLTIVQAWIDAGLPQSAHVMGSFESWASTVGGVLEIIGMGNAFMDNRDLLATQKVEEDEPVREFVLAWATKYQDKKVAASSLYKLAAPAPKLPYGSTIEQQQELTEYKGLLADLIIGSGELGRKQSFGHLLANYSDRVYSGWKIGKVGRGNGENWWQLLKVEPGQIVVLPGDE